MPNISYTESDFYSLPLAEIEELLTNATSDKPDYFPILKRAYEDRIITIIDEFASSVFNGSSIELTKLGVIRAFEKVFNESYTSGEF